MTIAGELSRKGYAVEMFEMESEAGGVLMYGIPEYRLPKGVVRREIARIEQSGVNIHLNTTIGKDLTIDSLFAQGFDAIFMATGTAKPKKLDIKGADMSGVRMAVWLLRRISLWHEGSICRDEVPIRDGHRVYVIGGGNTAMDAARSAIRMGAGRVFVVYHRTIDEMTALRSEYEEAVSEGVEFLWEAEIEEIIGEERVLKGVLIKQKEKCHIEPADLVVMAVGAVPASRIVNSTIGVSMTMGLAEAGDNGKECPEAEKYLNQLRSDHKDEYTIVSVEHMDDVTFKIHCQSKSSQKYAVIVEYYSKKPYSFEARHRVVKE